MGANAFSWFKLLQLVFSDGQRSWKAGDDKTSRKSEEKLKAMAFSET